MRNSRQLGDVTNTAFALHVAVPTNSRRRGSVLRWTDDENDRFVSLARRYVAAGRTPDYEEIRIALGTNRTFDAVAQHW